MFSNDLNELRALDARQSIKEQLEAEKLKLQMRMAGRSMEDNARKGPKWGPGVITRLPGAPDPEQDSIDTFWNNDARLGQISGRAGGGTGRLPGGAQIMGHLGPTMEGIGGAERAQSIQQPGMASYQADDIRRKAMAGLRGARG